MTSVDVVILVAYLGGVLGLSWWIARRQRTGDDYFLAGRRLGSAPLALSIVANQASAVSLVGAPVFVAAQHDGGLRWLQYELAVPLAMAVIIVVVLPVLRRVPGASIYAFAEQRFGRTVRRVLAAVFLVSRGLALGVVLYASSLVVAVTVGWPPDATIMAVGGFAVVYTSLGGLAADVWTDVVQLGVLWVGTIVAGAWLIGRGALDGLVAVDAGRLVTLVPNEWGLSGGNAYGFWPMLLGGLFLYTSYYGCDQSQAQRLLAAPDEATARRALVTNGLLRFPLVLTYCGFGLLLAGWLHTDREFAPAMSGRPADDLVPTFVAHALPPGLRGLMLAAILAAAMSSIDSALNSLAAVTLEDVASLPPERQPVWLSRATSLGWGLFGTASGMAAARIGGGVLALINQAGSLSYGPVLAVFVLAALVPAVTSGGALAGLCTGLATNISLAVFAPGVSWLWWNPAGFLVAVVTGVGFAGWRAGIQWPAGRPFRPVALLVGAFAVMLATLVALTAGVR